MKINSLNIYKPYSVAQNSFNEQGFVQRSSLKTQPDSFSKSSNPINFKGRQQRFIDSIVSMSKELKPCIIEQEFDFNKIKSVVSKYVPGIDLGIFNPVKNQIITKEGDIGYLKAPISFSADGKIVLQNRELLITPPRNNTFEEKIRVYKNVVHESTHAAQYDVDEKSRVELIKNFLKGRNLQNPETLNTLKMSNNMFKAVETDILGPLLTALKKKNNMPSPINQASDNTLKSLFEPIAGRDIDSYMKKVISEDITYLEQYGKVNRKFVLNFIELCAKNESEAYNFDAQAVKGALNIKSDTDLDLFPLLYNKLAQKAHEMA